MRNPFCHIRPMLFMLCLCTYIYSLPSSSFIFCLLFSPFNKKNFLFFRVKIMLLCFWLFRMIFHGEITVCEIFLGNIIEDNIINIFFIQLTGKTMFNDKKTTIMGSGVARIFLRGVTILILHILKKALFKALKYLV